MEAARDYADSRINEIPADCSGCCSCATCHVRIDQNWIDKVGEADFDSAETELGIKEEVWNNFSSEWKLEDLENQIKEITLSDLPAEIDTILKGQQIGRIRVKI